MDPFSLTGTLIALIQITSKIVTLCYDYRSSLKSSSREIVQITDELNSLRDVIESLLKIVERNDATSGSGSGSGEKTRLETIEKMFEEGGMLGGCLEELVRLKGKLEPREGWREVKRRLEWPLKEGEMRRALEGLERWKGVMVLAVVTDNASLSLGIKEDVGDLTRLFKRSTLDQESQSILQWLNASDPHSNHVANRKKRLPETGNWLLANKKYEMWFDESKTFLWLYGIPGSGKSVLCSTVVEDVAARSQLQSTTAFAYFYFNFNDTGERDTNAVLRSLIKQLATQYTSMPPSLLQLYRDHRNGAQSIEESSLVTTLRNLVLTFQSVYLIFDALDESSEVAEILDLLHEISTWNLSRLHILATSRQLPEIEDVISNICDAKICLQESKTNIDIAIYVKDKLANDKALAKWPFEVREQMLQMLLIGEDGMFQWVVCQLDMLKKCMSVNAIRKAMLVLPKSLDDTYDRLLLNVDQEYQPEVMKILQALTITRDPLSLEKIVEILAVDLESSPPRFHVDSRLLDPRGILLMCSSLVTMSPHSASSFSAYMNTSTGFHEPKTSAVRLAHASVADYLTQSNPSRHHEFHFSRNEARQFMAQTCVAYLLNPVFASSVDKSRAQLQKMRDEYPFLSHCVDFWPKYLDKEIGSASENHLDPRTRELLQSFFATSKLPKGGNFATWVRMLTPDVQPINIQNTEPLYYAASFGLLQVVKIILETEENVDINALGGRASASALHVAVYRNHTDVVKLLLERGANPSQPNVSNELPMYWAKGSGNRAVQKMLVKYGANERDLFSTVKLGKRKQQDDEEISLVLRLHPRYR